MTERWLSVVGIGEDGLKGLAPTSRALIDSAEVLIGGSRHLAMLPDDGREKHTWPSPIRLLLDRIESMRGRRVCVLATGDPMCFGVGSSLVRRIPRDEMLIIPAPSALALACARLGWPEHEVELMTLHGRPLALLESRLQPGNRLVILSENRATPHEVIDLLNERGYGGSRVFVLEHMGGEQERLLEGKAAEWSHQPGADLNTIAVDCIAELDAALLPRIPGLPDDAFRNDGQLTKREVRAATLAALGPVPGGLLWDVGAGSGSIAIEWMRTDRRCTAVAVEPHPGRRAMIAENASALGTPHLSIVDGRAPEALNDLDAPDAVFIGGGITTEGVVEACWAALKPGGRLVANVVTVEGEAIVNTWRGQVGGDLTRIAVSRAEPVGPYQGWRPLMPVTQWRATKPWDDAA